MRAAVLLLASMSCSAAQLPDMTIQWVRFETYQEVSRECAARNVGSTPNSEIPSCYYHDRPNHCVIVAKVPVAGEDDYAARDFIGRELGNCSNGHQFPTNPQ